MGEPKKVKIVTENNITIEDDVKKPPVFQIPIKRLPIKKPEWYIKLNPTQILIFQTLYDYLDNDKGNKISVDKIDQILNELQIDITHSMIQNVLNDLYVEDTIEIDFDEFLYLLAKQKNSVLSLSQKEGQSLRHVKSKESLLSFTKEFKKSLESINDKSVISLISKKLDSFESIEKKKTVSFKKVTEQQNTESSDEYSPPTSEEGSIDHIDEMIELEIAKLKILLKKKESEISRHLAKVEIKQLSYSAIVYFTRQNIKRIQKKEEDEQKLMREKKVTKSFIKRKLRLQSWLKAAKDLQESIPFKPHPLLQPIVKKQFQSKEDKIAKLPYQKQLIYKIKQLEIKLNDKKLYIEELEEKLQKYIEEGSVIANLPDVAHLTFLQKLFLKKGRKYLFSSWRKYKDIQHIEKQKLHTEHRKQVKKIKLFRKPFHPYEHLNFSNLKQPEIYFPKPYMTFDSIEIVKKIINDAIEEFYTNVKQMQIRRSKGHLKLLEMYDIIIPESKNKLREIFHTYFPMDEKKIICRNIWKKSDLNKIKEYVAEMPFTGRSRC